MESTLEYMVATAERFTTVRVSLTKGYYNGNSRSFCLRDNTTNTVHTCKIVLQQYDEDKKLQFYQLEVPELDLSHDYEIQNQYGLTCPLRIKGIVNDPKFDEKYAYDGDDLGPTYTKEYTSFKVWAPTSPKVMLEYHLKDETNIVMMKRMDRGVYYCKVMGDLDGADYVYLVKNDGVIFESTDPYAYSGTINSLRSSVIDLNKIKHKDLKLPEFKQKTDAIIYELSVRDFTSSVYSGINHRGQFLGFTEKETMTPSIGSTSGIDYIKGLGITHVQIMPMYDFATVEESKPQMLYNWGYDPNQYNIPEGSFSTNPNDPYARVQECVQMVEAFHEEGIRVNMDVVFNHVYNVNNHAFEKLVPHYYFRNDDFGNISNGTFCSNDINSCSFMVRKYIVDICKRWIELYHIDGYRFDLMGIIDVFTMNKVEEECRKLKSDIMVYGEGWDMPTMLPSQDKAMKSNHASMPNIGFFNDDFRNTVRGPNSNGNSDQAGYFTGNTNKIWDMIRYMRNLDVFTNPDQSINYCECHDNETCADKLAYTSFDNRLFRINRLVMMLGATIFSIGIPFINSGQEFFRTKHGIANSYNAPDDINQIKWQTRDKYEKYIQIFRDFVQLRKDNPGFRYKDKEEIKKNVSVNVDNGLIFYSVRQPQHENEEILIIYNPTYADYGRDMSDYELMYKIDEDTTFEGGYLSLPQVSMVILVKKHK